MTAPVEKWAERACARGRCGARLSRRDHGDRESSAGKRRSCCGCCFRTRDRRISLGSLARRGTGKSTLVDRLASYHRKETRTSWSYRRRPDESVFGRGPFWETGFGCRGHAGDAGTFYPLDGDEGIPWRAGAGDSGKSRCCWMRRGRSMC